MSKRKLGWGIILLGILGSLGLVSFFVKARGVTTTQEKSVKIGITIYDKNDVFISSMMAEWDKVERQMEVLDDTKVSINIAYAEENQTRQNEQVQKFISLGYDVICVNIVDRTSASEIIDKTKEAGIPVIFFNREPVEDDLYLRENVYYVGTDAKETAIMQGQMVVEKYRKDPQSVDKNGNGTIEYVMLEGESSHQDAVIRTEWSVRTLQDQGIGMEKLAGGIGNWERSQATALMENWLDIYSGEIELVISNNDDMAVGAVDALKNRNIDDILVVGIDGTAAGLEAVKFGHLLGTIVCGADQQAKIMYQLAVSLGLNGIPDESLEFVNGKYLWADLTTVIYEGD